MSLRSRLSHIRPSPRYDPPVRSPAALFLRSLVKCAINYRGERAAIIRQYYFDISSRFSPSVAVDAHGVRYYVATGDNAVGRPTFVSGGFDDDKLLRILNVVHDRTGRSLSGRDLVDIGANIGTTTIPAIKRFGASHVWAFEPALDNLALLRANMAANEVCDKVTIFPIGLSDTARQGQLELSARSSGDHRIIVTREDGYFNEPARPHVQVSLRTFDDVADEAHIDIDRLALVWIDAQGHEANILAGAQQLLRSSVSLVLEYWPYGLMRSSGLELLNQLVTQHYTTVLDIGRPPDPVEYRASELHRLQEIYNTPTSFTDLLLI